MENKKYTREDFEELRKIREENPELLSPKEKKLANLHPNEKGKTGDEHRGGRKKGVRNWSTHFKRLMGDKEFLKTIITSTPDAWNGLVGEYPADIIAAGVIATVTREVAKAVAEGKPLNQATQKSISLLNDLGYGAKTVLAVDDEQVGFFEKPVINFTVIPSKKEKNENQKEEHGD